jgi:hypothetical protein
VENLKVDDLGPCKIINASKGTLKTVKSVPPNAGCPE